MRLLVSVANPAEAAAALAGDADLIDAKDPASGALGSVGHARLRAIHRLVDQARPVTAALGEPRTEREAELAAREMAAAGACMVKLAFGARLDLARVRALLAAAMHGAGAADVVAVAFADAPRVGAASPAVVLDAAVACGARGLLLDTADKQGPGLTALWPRARLAGWVASAHDAGLLVALAGRLSDSDVALARELGADVAGVRGAACEGGRTGIISSALVRCLHAASRGAYGPGSREGSPPSCRAAAHA